jgi:hypothetical protein
MPKKTTAAPKSFSITSKPIITTTGSAVFMASFVDNMFFMDAARYRIKNSLAISEG